MALSRSIGTVSGFVLPFASPLQLLKVKLEEDALAVRTTGVFDRYLFPAQFGPGFAETVPPVVFEMFNV